MTEINYTRFYAKSLGTPRTQQDFVNFQALNSREPNQPVPIYPGEPFNPDRPHFKSIRDLVKYARETPGWQVGMHAANDTPSNYYGGNDWDWGFNTNAVLELFDQGWSDGFKAINYDMERAVNAAMLATMTDSGLTRDVHGASIDIGAFIQGDPECMFEFRDEAKPVLHLEVEVDYYLSAGLSANEMMHRGACIMAAVIALRRMGVFVTLYGAEKTYMNAARPRGSNKRFIPVRCYLESRIDMMNEGLTENLSEVLLAIAHPGFYRRVYFHAWASATGCWEPGLGQSARPEEDFIPKAGSGKIVIPGHFGYDANEAINSMGIDWDNSWASPEAAAGMVRMMLSAASTRR